MNTDSHLPTNRAFVVQLRAQSGAEDGPWAGRVEHLTSGQAAQFHSLEELLAFMERLLVGHRTATNQR